jgi:20S proteasome subunit alpha 4
MGSGGLMAWGNRKANAIGRSSKTVREFLERNYKEDMDREETIKLTVKSLLEVVQTGAKNIEIAIMEPGKEMEVCLSGFTSIVTHADHNEQMMSVEDIEGYVKDIEKEKQEEAARKKTRGGPSTSSAPGATTAGSGSS